MYEKRKSVEVNGKHFKSIAEAARSHGVIPSTAYSRIARKWTVTRAVTAPVQFRKGTLPNLLHKDAVRRYNKKHKDKIA